MKKFLTLLIALMATIAMWAQNNVITYKATEKLNKYKYSKGSNLNGFNNVSITKHSFSKGQGTITFSGEVTSIGKHAFDGCNSLTSITLPNSVTSIGDWAFWVCRSLTSITIPNGVTSIGDGTFCGCKALTSINIPNGVTSIGDDTFDGCNALSSINIPNGVTSIGKHAFYGCRLTSITIPKSVTSIGEEAFAGCSLISITWNAKKCMIPNPIFNSSVKSFIFGDSVQVIPNYICQGMAQLTSITIPDGVTSIGKHAFCKCSSITSITIPNGVTSIEDWTFFGCDSLTSITIPNGVTKIGESAFFGCSKLSSVDIPNSVTSIGASAFRFCYSITSINIPVGVTSIKPNTFSCCFKLKSVTIPNGVTNIGKDAFASCSKLVIHVPNESMSRFKNMAALSGMNVQGDAGSYLSPCSTSINPKLPPLLALVDNSLQLIEQNANNTIDANEQCKIRFQITNRGKGAAIGCEVKVEGTGSTAGLTFASQELPSIPIGTTQTIEIPVTANMNTIDGTASFTIEVTEPNGYGIDPMTLTVNTRAFDAPLVKIVDYAVSGNGTIQKKQPFDLQLLLQNTKYGKAEDVDVTLSVPSGVSLWEGEEKTHYATINGGEQQKLNYQLAISGNYAGTTVSINISIKEKYGKFAENKTINLALNQQLASATSVTLQGQQPQQVQREAIAIGVLGSAVDKNIPTTKDINTKTFAFIIANENYQQVSSVPMALNDGMIFKQYCQKTLGLLPENIKYFSNATLGNMARAIQQAKDIADAYQGNINIIFYYAGHGIPDTETKEAYLLPVDASGRSTSYCYSIDRLYRELGSTNANKIIVLLDACFSGSLRGDGMLASARGVVFKPRVGLPQGNMVVLSAATGDQTAFPYEAEGHGMFTYYLLKKLQETSGDVTLQDLYNYIRQNVSQKTSVVINKLQTPTIAAADELGDNWKDWTLK